MPASNMKTVTHFAQEAPTPTISNRSPTKKPPPLALEEPAAQKPSSPSSASFRTMNLSSERRQPRFSKPTTTPIIAYPPASNMPVNRMAFHTTTMSPQQTALPEITPSSSIAPPSVAIEPTLAYTGINNTLSSFPLEKDGSAYLVLLACDLLKAGVPLQVFRNWIRRVFRFLFEHDTQHFLNSGLAFRMTSTRSMAKQRQSQNNQQGLVQIRGLPNLGQTCFLNSVLQALASLSPFLIYLDRIVRVGEELALDYGDADNTNFSCQLLEVLNGVNGSDNKIDPRSLLKRIGEHNPQFRSRHMEQQDAQELLQTLVDIVITDARLDKTCASDQPHLRFLEEDDYSYDETLTAAMAGEDRSVDWSPSSSVDLEEGGDRFISFPDLVHQIESEMEQRGTAATIGQGNTCKKTQSHQREEKKQEEFEICAEDSTILDEADLIVESRVLNNVTTIRDENDVQKKEFQHLSASMKIMKSTMMSSITPSPLSGWIGSALKCCKCHHVRAIRNAPFLNIPLVPTSVLNYHANVHKPTGRSANTPNRSPLPSCSLDECLQDFTSVERVHDVECASCSIRKELEKLDDEAMLLRGAIQSMEKRTLQKGGDPAEHTKVLRQDLSRIELRRIKLKFMDPDDGDLSWLKSEEELSLLAVDEEGAIKKLERCDALKCLTLTRCPSILCCHIQRRYFDPLTNRMEKCVQHVEFPQVLDISPFCAYSPMTSTSWAAGTSQEETIAKTANISDRKKLPYRLQGMIEHRGNAYGGHYVCYRRDRSGNWFRISDSNITPIPWRQVRTCQAYMLFYEAM